MRLPSKKVGSLEPMRRKSALEKERVDVLVLGIEIPEFKNDL